MLLNRILNKSLVFLFLGFVFHVVCLENHKKCFGVEEKIICYFIPNVLSVDWNTAWKTCRDLHATLPVIPSENVQNVLRDYLRDYLLPFLSVWTAGRYIDRDEWRWVNGEAFSGTDKPSCHRSGSFCRHETQAVLTKQLKYEARYPVFAYDYICRLSGVSCTNKSEYFIPWKDGCLKWANNDRQPLNRARNKCLEDGGDLATFSEDGDLQRLQQFSHMLDNSDHGYLIGLHRKWWIWNATDVQDIKYNLLDASWDFENSCLFIDYRARWMHDPCASKKNVICQTVTDTYTASLTMLNTDSSATGVITGFIFVIALVITVSLVRVVQIRNSSARQTSDKNLPTESSYQTLQHRLHEQDALENNQNYAELQITHPQNDPTEPRYLDDQLQYEIIGDIQTPPVYLEITSDHRFMENL